MSSWKDKGNDFLESIYNDVQKKADEQIKAFDKTLAEKLGAGEKRINESVGKLETLSSQYTQTVNGVVVKSNSNADRIAKLEAENKELREKLGTRATENQKTNDAIKAKEKIIEGLNSKVEQSKQDNTFLERRVAAIEKKLKTAGLALSRDE